MERVDVAIIGSGVLGLAAAARLADETRSVVVLEKHPRYGVETSSRNSEVVHGGIYYPADSLKNRLCHEGRRALYRLAQDAGIFVKKTGKLIVSVNREQTEYLKGLHSRATAGGAENLKLIDGAEARRRVPGLNADAALWSPESGIVDSEELMGYFYAAASDRGAIFLFGSEVTQIRPQAEGTVLTFARGEQLIARYVVNAAGLHSDRVAEMAGIDVDQAGYRLHWCRGLYFRVRSGRALEHLVYPVPEKHSLGIHLTPDREGRIRLGPDAEFVDSLDYDVPIDRAAAFTESVARYWPEIRKEDLIADTAGIRPKLSGPKEGFRDYVIAEENARGLRGWINLIGIESPGLTASPAIADMVARMIE